MLKGVNKFTVVNTPCNVLERFEFEFKIEFSLLSNKCVKLQYEHHYRIK